MIVWYLTSWYIGVVLREICTFATDSWYVHKSKDGGIVGNSDETDKLWAGAGWWSFWEFSFDINIFFIFSVALWHRVGSLKCKFLNLK